MTQESEGRQQIREANAERVQLAQGYFNKAISLIDPTDSTSPHEFLHVSEAQIDCGLDPVMTPDEIDSHRNKTRVTASGFDEDLAVLYAKFGDSGLALQLASMVIQNALVNPKEHEMREVMRMSEHLSRALKSQDDRRAIAVMSESALSEYLSRRADRIQWPDASLVVNVAKTQARAMYDPIPTLTDLGGRVLRTVRTGRLVPKSDYGISAQRLAEGHAEVGDLEGALELAGTIDKHDSITAHYYVDAHAKIAVEQAKRKIDPQGTLYIFLPVVQGLKPTFLGEEFGDTRKREKAYESAALAENIYRRNPYNYLTEARFIVYGMPRDSRFTKIEALNTLAKTEGIIEGKQSARHSLAEAISLVEQMDPRRVSPMVGIDIPNHVVDLANTASETGNFDIADKLLGKDLGEDDFPPYDTRGVDLRIPAYAKLGAAVLKASAN